MLIRLNLIKHVSILDKIIRIVLKIKIVIKIKIILCINHIEIMIVFI